MMNPRDRPLSVLMMPDYRSENPYQRLLAQALEKINIGVQFPDGYRRIFPILRTVRAGSPTVLHLHWLEPYLKGENWLIRWVYSLKFLLDLWLVRQSGVRIIWTIHNQLAHDTRFPQLDRWVRRHIAQLADCIIVHHQSALEATATADQFDPSKACVIPHGHYRQVYPPLIDPSTARSQLGIPQHSKVYLNLGMLRPYKGIESLLEIWKNHPEIVQNHTLLIAGKAVNADYERSIAQAAAGINNVILHEGFIADSDIPLYFSAANVVVLPFQKILTSGSLILAMSYGKPIVAPSLGGIQETLEPANQILYDAAQPQGLLFAIQESTAIDLEALQKKMTQACDRLDWGAVAQKTAQAYRFES
jgi:beta-1,4-mannosyltransferase